ncbi:GGDEF-domain containing protein, partial [Mycobacterium sp. ITM-2017-0098]
MRPRLIVTAGVPVLAVLNACAFWGDQAARLGELTLQVVVSVGAALCGLVAARHVRGLARWWRLLYVLALVTWVFGQVSWYVEPGDTASTVSRIAYLTLPLLALGSVLLLV